MLVRSFWTELAFKSVECICKSIKLVIPFTEPKQFTCIQRYANFHHTPSLLLKSLHTAQHSECHHNVVGFGFLHMLGEHTTKCPECRSIVDYLLGKECANAVASLVLCHNSKDQCKHSCYNNRQDTRKKEEHEIRHTLPP